MLSHSLSNKMIYQWNNTPQLCLSFTADSTQSPTVVTLMQLFHSPALLARNSVLVVSSERAIFVWPWKMLPVSVICFISWWMKRSKHGLFVFPPKKTLIWRRHCSIGQSLLQFDVKAKSHARCVRSLNQSNRSISVRLLFLLCSRVFIWRSYENRSDTAL